MSLSDDNPQGPPKTIEFRVTGRVQGVFFRASTRSVAEQFGITGWVKNRPDGFVEGKATGKEPALSNFTGWLRQGPEMAKVDSLDVRTIDLETFDRFEIR